MKPFTRLFEQILYLLKKSLNEKWHTESIAELDESCPFCNDAVRRNYLSSSYSVACDVCLCPDAICFDHAEDGFISNLWTRYQADCEIQDLDPQDLIAMRSLFQTEIEALERELNSE